MCEVETAKTTASKATDPAVKSYAGMLVNQPTPKGAATGHQHRQQDGELIARVLRGQETGADMAPPSPC